MLSDLQEQLEGSKELGTKYTALSNELSEDKRAHTELQHKSDTAHRENQTQEKALSDAKTEVFKLKKTLNDKEERIETLESESSDRHVRMVELQAQNRGLEGTIGTLSTIDDKLLALSQGQGSLKPILVDIRREIGQPMLGEEMGMREQLRLVWDLLAGPDWSPDDEIYPLHPMVMQLLQQICMTSSIAGQKTIRDDLTRVLKDRDMSGTIEKLTHAQEEGAAAQVKTAETLEELTQLFNSKLQLVLSPTRKKARTEGQPINATQTPGHQQGAPAPSLQMPTGSKQASGPLEPAYRFGTYPQLPGSSRPLSEFPQRPSELGQHDRPLPQTGGQQATGSEFEHLSNPAESTTIQERLIALRRRPVEDIDPDFGYPLRDSADAAPSFPPGLSPTPKFAFSQFEDNFAETRDQYDHERMPFEEADEDSGLTSNSELLPGVAPHSAPRLQQEQEETSRSPAPGLESDSRRLSSRISNRQTSRQVSSPYPQTPAAAAKPMTASAPRKSGGSSGRKSNAPQLRSPETVVSMIKVDVLGRLVDVTEDSVGSVVLAELKRQCSEQKKSSLCCADDEHFEKGMIFPSNTKSGVMCCRQRGGKQPSDVISAHHGFACQVCEAAKYICIQRELDLAIVIRPLRDEIRPHDKGVKDLAYWIKSA